MGWTVTGLEDVDTTQDPLTFRMPQNDVTVAASFRTASYTGGSSGGSTSGSSSSGGSVSYPVNMGAANNGSVSISPKNARAGETVTVTAKPDDGYELDGLTVTDQSGNDMKLTDNGSGYTFTMPAGKVTVDAAFVKTDDGIFSDVPAGYWAADAIAWARENGYMNGRTADTFDPNGTVTRQQLWMILARLSGEQPADMAEARIWAMANGVSDGSNPGSAVSRQQMVTMLYRFAGRKGYDVSGKASLAGFPDNGSVADYAKDAMAWSAANGIVTGTAQGTLDPAGTAARAQFAVILMRFCQAFRV